MIRWPYWIRRSFGGRALAHAPPPETPGWRRVCFILLRVQYSRSSTRTSGHLLAVDAPFVPGCETEEISAFSFLTCFGFRNSRLPLFLLILATFRCTPARSQQDTSPSVARPGVDHDRGSGRHSLVRRRDASAGPGLAACLRPPPDAVGNVRNLAHHAIMIEFSRKSNCAIKKTKGRNLPVSH
jgi:hypothetical protein